MYRTFGDGFKCLTLKVSQICAVLKVRTLQKNRLFNYNSLSFCAIDWFGNLKNNSLQCASAHIFFSYNSILNCLRYKMSKSVTALHCFKWLLLFNDSKIKMARKPEKKQKENLVRCTGEGRRWKGNIREGKTETILEVRWPSWGWLSQGSDWRL